MSNAERLFAFVYAEGRGFTQITSCKFVPGTKKKGGAWQEGDFYPHPQSLGFALDRAAELDARGRDTYISAHLHTTKERKEANVAPVWTIANDTDSGQLPDDLPSSARVESSPGRFQDYFRLTRAVSAEQAKNLGKRLAIACGTDASGVDLSQVLRIPDTHNRTHPGDHLVRLVWLDEGRIYDPDELDRILPPLSPKADQQTAGEAQDDDDPPPVRLSGHALERWHGTRFTRLANGEPERSGALFALACDLLRAGGSVSGVTGWIAERDARFGWDKYVDRPQLYRATALNAADEVAKDPAAADAAPDPSAQPSDGPCRRCPQLEAELARTNERMSLLIASRLNPWAKKVGKTAERLIFHANERTAAAALDDRGFFRLTIGHGPRPNAHRAKLDRGEPLNPQEQLDRDGYGVAKDWNSSAQTISTDLTLLQDQFGFCEVEARKGDPKPIVDTETGEIVGYRPTPETWVRLPYDLDTALRKLATLEPNDPAAVKKHGGDRPRKPLCPGCGVEAERQWRCPNCGRHVGDTAEAEFQDGSRDDPQSPCGFANKGHQDGIRPQDGAAGPGFQDGTVAGGAAAYGRLLGRECPPVTPIWLPAEPPPCLEEGCRGVLGWLDDRRWVCTECGTETGSAVAEELATLAGAVGGDG